MTSQEVCPYRIRDRIIEKGVEPELAHKLALERWKKLAAKKV